MEKEILFLSDYLYQFFGKVGYRPTTSIVIPKNLPVWIKGKFTFYKIELSENQSLDVVKVNNKTSIDDAIKFFGVGKNLGINISLMLFETLDSREKKLLLQNRIPHLTLKGDIYAPEIGLIYKENVKSWNEVEVKEKLFPFSLKLVVLYLLKPDIFLDVSSMLQFENYFSEAGYSKSHSTISRSINQLNDLGFLNFEGRGPHKRFKFYDREVVWERLLRADVETIVSKSREYYLPSENDYKWAYSFDTALSKISDLNLPSITTIAMSLTEFKKWKDDETPGVPFGDFGIKGGLVVEVWKDDPTVFTEQGCVNPIELALYLKRTNEPRIRLALAKAIDRLNLNSEIIWEAR